MSEHHPSLDDPTAWVPYRYIISRPAAIAFVALFSLTTALHTYQMCKRKTWYFIPMVVGGTFEILGYLGRILSSNDPWALGPFIMQSLLLLIAPALFAASIYIILGRIILLTDGEKHSLIRQKLLTKAFVIGDINSFFVQSGGGGIQAAGSLALLHIGEKIIVAGLFLQLAFFGLFVAVAAIFHYRLVKANPSISNECTDVSVTSQDKSNAQRLTEPSLAPVSRPHQVNVHELPWKRHLIVLYAASTLIMIRSIFRIAEYMQGNNGYLLRHEYFLYIFDAALMFGVMVLFNWSHPAEITDLYKERVQEQEANFAMQRRRYEEP